MAQDRTGGFDLLVQISENELNGQIAAQAAAGGFMLSSFSAPVNAFGLTGRLDLNLGTPVADLDRPRPQLGLTVRFEKSSQLEVTAPIALVVPIAGTIVIVDAVQMRPGPGTQQAVLDFTGGPPSVTVTFDGDVQAQLAPLLTPLGVTVPQAEVELANQIRAQLVASVQRLAVTPPIAVADDTNPVTPFSIDVTTVNDTGAADRDALTFGVRTSSASGGNINLITESFIPGGSQSVLMFSNLWLLSQVIRPTVAGMLGVPVSAFDTPCRLNTPVPAPGGPGTLTNLEARVEANRIRVDGRATASGTGWSAVSTFTFFIDLAFAGGTITATATTPTVNTNFWLEWWVWLIGIGLGALFGGIIGAIVAAIVLAIVTALVQGLITRLVGSGLTTALGTIPPIPLGPIGSGLTMTGLVLDDLEVRGSILRVPQTPIRSTGSHSSGQAFAIDLDTGVVGPQNAASRTFDLEWAPGIGITMRNLSGFTVTGASYGSLTPAELRLMPYAGTQLPAVAIPTAIPLPFFGQDEIVLGVRTSLGRLAKVRAWRNLLDQGNLNIFWTTYDTPIPELDIALRWSIIETDKASESYIDRDFATCTRSGVSRRATIEAWPKLVTFPVDYQWCLCGTVLEEGDGEIEVSSGTLTYHLAGRYLDVETELGQAIDCELCVSAIDAKGRELFSCTRLSCAGSETECGPGRVFIPEPTIIDWIPCDPLIAIDSWTSITSERVTSQLQNALN